MPIEKIQLNQFTDPRGKLSVGQFPDQLPFTPARFFVVSDVPNSEVRGKHAHKTNHQILICLAGSLRAKFHDGNSWQEFYLRSSSEALSVPAMHFGELSEFAPGTILLVLASEAYDAAEYINDFQEFLDNY